ncbi:YbhB/YbcL family Raf kinase inhibitor-like protein [Candidatus Kaiserbacteria bacterium]|nr:YbhB/YbcL family Raf kinase inhibitor-like protein [Candidatus Kaiserbacteria bacterium]
MALTSPVFENGELIPSKYTCDGENVSPLLAISGVSEDVQSLVLIMDDPDVPKAVRDNQMFDHWVLFNIDPTTTHIGEGEGPGILGSNTMGEAAYIGPCPPTQFEPKEHRYIFQLYALDTMLDIREGASKEVVKSAMKGHILQKTELMGKYSRIESE